LDIENMSMSRGEFIDKLKEHNIGASVHFIPLHLHPYYQKTYGYKKGDFPNAEYLFDREVSLPLYPGMSEEDIRYVAEAIKEIIGK
jgi:dTDP-4-amino-4,6-dideoxygalactose transaminase